MPEPRRLLRRLTDTRLLARATAHLTVTGLVVLTAAVGVAVSQTDSGAAGAQFFDLISRVRGAAGDAAPSNPLFARIELDPQAAREDGEPLAVRMPRPTVPPKPTPVPVAVDATPLAAPDTGPAIGTVENEITSAQPAQPAPAAAPPAGAGLATGSLVWPVPGGSISQYFHAGHLALDIAASYGTTVVAADGGVVTSAGWRNNGGGYVVEIDHGNGIRTLYNHLGSVWVSPGQAVAAGQGIAGVGCTGICTGPHVHFETVVNGVISNPLYYLP